METALWATIGSTLALIFKGVAAGDKSDVESQLEVLRKQLADANTRNGELKNQYGTLTLQARKEALYEEKTKADTQRREIAEAETVWSRATPEVLLQFAKDRQKIASPNPMDDVNPFKPPGDGETAPNDGETAPNDGETAPGGLVAVVANPGDTDESPMADEVVNPPEEDVPAKETANPPPPPPPPSALKPEDLPVEVEEDPLESAPSSSTRTSFDQEPKQVLKGGAAVDKSLAAKVPAINEVYKNLEQSSMARGYVVRGSLMALYGKLVAVWKSEKGEDPLPPELQQSAFLKGVKEELLAIATGKSSAVADARASAKELKDTVKGIRKWADDTVSESKQVLNEGTSLRNWFDTVPPKKLAKQYPALRGLVVLDASNEDAYVASVNAKTFLNQSKEYVRQWNQLSGLIDQGRDALAAKRSQSVPDDKLLAHLQESIDTLSEAVGAMKALNEVMRTDKETILREIETNRSILKDTGIRKGDIEKGEAQVQEELDARRKAREELEEFRRQDASAAQAPAAEVPAAEVPVVTEEPAAEVPAAEEPAAIPPPPTSAPPPLTPGSIATADAKRAAKKASQTTVPEAPPSQTILHDGVLKATPTLIQQATAATKSLESTKVLLDKGAALLPKPYLYFDGCRVSTVTLQLRDLCGRLLQILGREVPKLKRTFDSYVSETKKADVPIYNTTLQPKTETRKQTIQDAKRSTQATIQELDTRSAALAADVKRLVDLHPTKGGGTFETIEELYSTIVETSTKIKQLLEFVEGLGTTAAQMRKIIDTVARSPVLSEEKQEAEKTECSKGVADLKKVIGPTLTTTETGDVTSSDNPLFRKAKDAPLGKIGEAKEQDERDRFHAEERRRSAETRLPGLKARAAKLREEIGAYTSVPRDPDASEEARWLSVENMRREQELRTLEEELQLPSKSKTMGALEIAAPETAGIPPGDFAGAPVLQPPISATEAASALPGMAPETPGTTLELPSVGERPPAAAAPADPPGQGLELTPVKMYQKTSTRGLTKGEAQEAPAVKAARSMRNLFKKGGSRKSTFKRRRVGKQNGRRTRRSKNRADRTHSNAR